MEVSINIYLKTPEHNIVNQQYSNKIFLNIWKPKRMNYFLAEYQSQNQPNRK